MSRGMHVADALIQDGGQGQADVIFEPHEQAAATFC